MIWDLLFIWFGMTFGMFTLFVAVDAAVRWAWVRVRN